MNLTKGGKKAIVARRPSLSRREPTKGKLHEESVADLIHSGEKEGKKKRRGSPTTSRLERKRKKKCQGGRNLPFLVILWPGRRGKEERRHATPHPARLEKGRGPVRNVIHASISISRRPKEKKPVWTGENRLRCVLP